MAIYKRIFRHEFPIEHRYKMNMTNVNYLTIEIYIIIFCL
jgi:hypothetical protein